jgi:hypothetical protein
MIKEVSRSDACHQMSATISKDSSLSESDKKLLSEKLQELGKAS